MIRLFRAYAADAILVFILSASSPEEKYYVERLQERGQKVQSITTDYTAADRKELYANGGVFFITARIMVVDFLKDVVPAEKITGMIVLRAHNVIESSQVTFHSGSQKFLNDKRFSFD